MSFRALKSKGTTEDRLVPPPHSCIRERGLQKQDVWHKRKANGEVRAFCGKILRQWHIYYKYVSIVTGRLWLDKVLTLYTGTDSFATLNLGYGILYRPKAHGKTLQQVNITLRVSAAPTHCGRKRYQIAPRFHPSLE